MNGEQYMVLVVDDDENNREMLARRVTRLGYGVSLADSGQQCIQMLHEKMFDLVLLDIMMPGMNGYKVLEYIRGEETMRQIPIIMVSAVDELESVVKCIELGAEDYLIKPINSVLLQARVRATLEKKALQDQSDLYMHQVEAEKQRADELLRAILPEHVVEELKENNRVLPRRHEHVAVLFCDIAGFTPYCERHDPEEVVANLSELTEAFETLALTHKLEKINSIGDEFVAACGLGNSVENPVLNATKCGLDMIRSAKAVAAGWEVRVGIHIGPVISGVVGRRKFLFGLWGDTVNTTSRAQSHGLVGAVNVTREAWECLGDTCEGRSRGLIEVKGKGEMELFLVDRVLV
ncbi:MAG: adenylate/guanylate cyclase domain-containing protein [bacterium]